MWKRLEIRGHFLVVQSLSYDWHLLPYGLRLSKLPCPSRCPRVCSNLCPLSWWCYLTISSAATPFSFCLQSFPISGFFPVSRLFTLGSQSTGASASASVLPMTIQGWFLLGLIGGFHGGSDGKESTCNVGDLGLIPGLERSPEVRAWQSTPVCLPGESPWTEEPRGLQSMGSQRVGHNWSPKHKTGLIALISSHFKGPSQVFSSTTIWNHQFFDAQLSLCSNSHIHTLTGKTVVLTVQTFIGKMMSLLFNMQIVIAFLPGSKCPLISWLQSPSSVIFEPPKIKYVTASTFPSSICHEVMGPDAMITVSLMLSFKPAFHFPLIPSSRHSLGPLHFLPLR